jgi:hypothetical protein
VQSRFTMPSAATVANSLVRFLFAEHTDVLIVKIDLTRIGPLSRSLPPTSRLTIQNSARAFWAPGTWAPANSKKQASEITQATQRRRPSFGRSWRTQSKPHQATKQV